jgi:hypothetical protein
MEDVALGHAWTPFREVMHIHFNLDVDRIDDDVVHYDAFMMIGVLLAIRAPI